MLPRGMRPFLSPTLHCVDDADVIVSAIDEDCVDNADALSNVEDENVVVPCDDGRSSNVPASEVTKAGSLVVLSLLCAPVHIEDEHDV